MRGRVSRAIRPRVPRRRDERLGEDIPESVDIA